MDEQGQEISGLTLNSLSGGGALGRPERWPPSLKNAARQLLAARTPIAVAWGSDQLTLHNEAFARVVGVKGQHGAGLPFRQLFPEIWQRVGALLEEVMRRGEPALLENQLFCIYRNGYAEEIYLSFRCDPVADQAAIARGVMVMVEETTAQVVSARRTAALHDVSASGARAHSVEDACDDALQAVSRHSTDIPFALLYAHNANQGRSRLIATAVLAAGTEASPHVLAFDSAGGAASWPVGTAIGAKRTVVVKDLLTRFEPLPAGDWPLAPRCAAIVPLATREPGRPDGALILGVSARRELDTSYLDFIELVAKHVVAVITAGRLREESERDVANSARTRALKARVAGVLEERTRLAREIHDTLLQDVTGIALQLRAALPHLQASPDDTLTTLERVADLAESTSREARQVVWDMRPNALNEQEFAQAVEIAAHRTLAGAPLALYFTATGRARRLDEDAQHVVLRVVQEAMANVVRHAAANAVRLTLSFGPRRLRVAVADDGRGFAVQPDFRSYSGHWGLVGMQERAEQIGGSLRVRSVPPRGTTVTLELPLPSARTKRPLVLPQGGKSAIA
jgi:signal transduction histidine kinase